MLSSDYMQNFLMFLMILKPIYSQLITVICLLMWLYLNTCILEYVSFYYKLIYFYFSFMQQLGSKVLFQKYVRLSLHFNSGQYNESNKIFVRTGDITCEALSNWLLKHHSDFPQQLQIHCSHYFYFFLLAEKSSELLLHS